MFRSWIIRQGNTVRVHKLTEIVISLWLEIIKLDKEWFNVILLYGTILEYHIWNKWKCMSVNKWLTLISYQCMKKGSSQQQQTWQISTVNLISVTKVSEILHNSCLIRWMQQKFTKNSVSWPRIQPRSLASQSVTLTITLECFSVLVLGCNWILFMHGVILSATLNHYTRMFSVLVLGCNWILFMNGWFCQPL